MSIGARPVEVWRGKKQIGTIMACVELDGRFVVFPYFDGFKPKSITFEIGTRVLEDNGTDFIIRRILMAPRYNRNVKKLLYSTEESGEK